MTATLFSINYSPWSQQALWALDHHQILYKKKEYLPIIGVPMLRLRLKRSKGRVTVPVFFDGEHILDDSYDIALHADVKGNAPTLFPKALKEAISQWVQRLEQVKQAGRTLTTIKTSQNPSALKESLPSPLQNSFLGQKVGGFGIKYLMDKYEFGPEDINESRQTMREILTEAQKSLRHAPYLLEEFTYADIALALTLQFVSPVEHPSIKLGPNSRRCWTEESLAKDFADLLPWRDQLFADHRKRQAKA